MIERKAFQQKRGSTGVNQPQNATTEPQPQTMRRRQTAPPEPQSPDTLIPRAHKRLCRDYIRQALSPRRPTIHEHIKITAAAPRQRGQTPRSKRRHPGTWKDPPGSNLWPGGSCRIEMLSVRSIVQTRAALKRRGVGLQRAERCGSGTAASLDSLQGLAERQSALYAAGLCWCGFAAPSPGYTERPAELQFMVRRVVLY